jgi:hypothetical protein
VTLPVLVRVLGYNMPTFEGALSRVIETDLFT